METVPEVEEQEHKNDLYPIVPGVLVDILVVGVSHVEECRLSLRLREIWSLSRHFLSIIIINSNYFVSFSMCF